MAKERSILATMFTASIPHPAGSSHYAMFVVLPLLAWRFYVRFRRMVGRQRLSGIRPWITVVVFPILVAVFAHAARSNVDLLGWLGGGVLAGSLLGVLGIRKTRFETTPEGMFYTPNAHLGIGLSLLFASRILFRLFGGPGTEWAAEPGGHPFAASPLTLATFGLLAGYYVSYAIGLIRNGMRDSHSRPEPEEPTPPTSH